VRLARQRTLVILVKIFLTNGVRNMLPRENLVSRARAVGVEGRVKVLG
jgi:hypothetical protein